MTRNESAGDYPVYLRLHSSGVAECTSMCGNSCNSKERQTKGGLIFLVRIGPGSTVKLNSLAVFTLGPFGLADNFSVIFIGR